MIPTHCYFPLLECASHPPHLWKEWGDDDKTAPLEKVKRKTESQTQTEKWVVRPLPVKTVIYSYSFRVPPRIWQSINHRAFSVNSLMLSILESIGFLPFNRNWKVEMLLYYSLLVGRSCSVATPTLSGKFTNLITYHLKIAMQIMSFFKWPKYLVEC